MSAKQFANRMNVWYCYRILAFLCAGLTAVASHAASSRQSLDLGFGWEFRQAGGGQDTRVPSWTPAVVPGDVHLDLLRNKLIPDPFYRDNVSAVQWIEDADWEYRKVFLCTPHLRHVQNADLVFDGLDTTARVYLNDQLILQADNMFRQWRVNVKPYLKAGENTIRVVFPSSIREAARIAAQDPWRRKTGAPTPEKTYLRKAAYEYGWDWGPRLVTSGIWKAAHLETWDNVRISDLYVRQSDIKTNSAHLSVETSLEARQAGAATITLHYSRNHVTKTYSQSVLLHSGENQLSFPVQILKPDLWYPAGYGAQPLYAFALSCSQGGEVVDEAVRRVGLRSVVLRRDLDQWGRSFEFVVNGIPVFAKGASTIPFDSFPSRVTDADYKRILTAARDANMNMVRQWGGGYYESESFYNLCDELGLMVWQDFMFGNEWQPGTYEFRENVQKEAEEEVRRLRNHASVVLLCGNNETEASWRWGRTAAMTKGDPEIARRMWQNYLVLFNGDIGGVVAKLASNIPFWPSSPSADYEDTSGDFAMPGLKDLSGPQTFMSGDMHNYGVDTGEDYERYFARFLSEYGIMSFANMRTIEGYTQPDDRRNALTRVMLAHQDGNAFIVHLVEKRFGQPKNLSSLVYLSQIAQAEQVKLGAEHLRRNRPRSMGSLFWQLNDCWPGTSLSSIDYSGRWKALQYYARRFYNPLLISPHLENGYLNVYVVSDEMKKQQAHFSLKLMQADGTTVLTQVRDVSVPPLSSGVYGRLPVPTIDAAMGKETQAMYAVAELSAGGKLVSRNLILLSPDDHASKPKSDVSAYLSRRGSEYVLRLSAQAVTRNVYVSFEKVDASVSDNFVDLLPGMQMVIKVSSRSDLAHLRNGLRVISQGDAVEAAK